MGKQRLARLLGVRTPTSRRLQERFRGETQGHGTHPDCVRVRQIKAVHPEWGAHRIAQALAISIDHAKLHLARYLGAQSGANHNSQRLYYLGQLLEAWFHRTADVHVECCQAPRHYVVYGRNLIGFAHGHNERHDKLPIIMATERPTEWGMTTHREYHLGHLHSKQLKMFVPTADHQGVLVRIIPSLCPPDSWHAAMGYSGKLGAEAYYWDSEQRCVATFTHSPA